MPEGREKLAKELAYWFVPVLTEEECLYYITHHHMNQQDVDDWVRAFRLAQDVPDINSPIHYLAHAISRHRGPQGLYPWFSREGDYPMDPMKGVQEYDKPYQKPLNNPQATTWEEFRTEEEQKTNPTIKRLDGGAWWRLRFFGSS